MFTKRRRNRMRTFSMFLASAIAGALAVAGCSSDDDATGTPSGAGAGATSTQCVGTYSDFSSTEFNAQTTSGKACSANGAAICSQNVTAIVGTCGGNCYTTAEHTDAAQAECVQPCIAEKVTLSEACQEC